ncbi:MAG: dsrC [Ignavibacteria bacterium]|nr:dsrC [Ignavibacteria bacterium]
MPVLEYNEIKLTVDEDGFMLEPEKWDESIAAVLAQTEAVKELTEEHWKIINFLRNYYINHGMAPKIRKLCRDTGFSLKQIYELFPSGPAKGACKVAGLEKPTGCV